VLCVVALALQVSLPAQAPATDSWAQFRGNPKLTGIAATTTPAAPTVRWTYDAGEAFDSSPAIATAPCTR